MKELERRLSDTESDDSQNPKGAALNSEFRNCKEKLDRAYKMIDFKEAELIVKSQEKFALEEKLKAMEDLCQKNQKLESGLERLYRNSDEKERRL